MDSKQVAHRPGGTGNPDRSNIMTAFTITPTRQQAIDAVSALTDESGKKEVMSVFSQARKAFGRIKSFQAVEAAAWDVALAGGCYGRVQHKLIDFVAHVNA